MLPDRAKQAARKAGAQAQRPHSSQLWKVYPTVSRAAARLRRTARRNPAPPAGRGWTRFGVDRSANQATMAPVTGTRSEEHTSELQALMRISYAVFCLKKKKHTKT